MSTTCSISQSNIVQFPAKPVMIRTFKQSFSGNISFVHTLSRTIKTYCTAINKASTSNNLFSRISPIRESSQVIPVIQQWVDEGRMLRKVELQRIIRDLRSRKRYPQALQVSEYMSNENLGKFSSSDCAVHLDLIGVVVGSEAAEDYFHRLKDREKNEKTYGALLNCYAREGLLAKSVSHAEEMKELGYASYALVYNNLMSLYKQKGQLDKVSELFEEMKQNGVPPNNFTYRIGINCYGEKSDYAHMEALLEEMENNPHITMDWLTYSIVSNFYIRANQKEKAVLFLKKLEDTLHKDPIKYNHLVSLHGLLGHTEQVTRLWALQKVVCKKHVNRDYITMMGALVKLREIEKARELLQEWESACHTYDFRVPNVLLIGYCQKGQAEEAEAMLRDIVKKGHIPAPNCWAIIASGYMKKDNIEKAYECLKEALAVKEQNVKWDPKLILVCKILWWLGERGELDEVRNFIGLLKPVIPTNRKLYDVLSDADVRDKRDLDRILASLEEDCVEENDAMAEKLPYRRRRKSVKAYN